MNKSFNQLVRLAFFATIAFIMVQCKNASSPDQAGETPTASASIAKTQFGITPDGEEVDKYTLKNKQGMQVDVITYGGIITSWTAPDKNGNYANVVLGYDSLAQYIRSNPYFGALIGRYGNRIAKGKFSIDGNNYTLETNDGQNHLHGGVKGFDKVVWTAAEQPTDKGVALKLTYVSQDGEGGYPGTLTSTVVYHLTDDNTLEVSYVATTDKKTIVNLTQHAYFNLSGDFTKNILDHELTIDADQYLPVDATLIPTGELRPVNNTAFDFRQAKSIGKDIEQKDEQLTKGKGYDHCWVLNKQGSFRKVSTAYHPATGRYLEIFTDEPGLQFYCGNFLDGTLPAPGGGTYAHRTGFCLETQHYPDSPNQKSFPSVILAPGEQYATKTTFKFSTK
ncbi:MAG: galactose mutarotase [Saprospiraceae bacterium]|jgi:aldose 1-epimerase|nr:galactose mutarotase [Saprospiraceae bacterium]